jgi:hypothetical protein
MIRTLTLKLSIWRGVRRQRAARLVRSSDVKRGLATNISAQLRLCRERFGGTEQ